MGASTSPSNWFRAERNGENQPANACWYPWPMVTHNGGTRSGAGPAGAGRKLTARARLSICSLIRPRRVARTP